MLLWTGAASTLFSPCNRWRSVGLSRGDGSIRWCRCASLWWVLGCGGVGFGDGSLTGVLSTVASSINRWRSWPVQKTKTNHATMQQSKHRNRQSAHTEGWLTFNHMLYTLVHVINISAQKSNRLLKLYSGVKVLLGQKRCYYSLALNCTTCWSIFRNLLLSGRVVNLQ